MAEWKDIGSKAKNLTLAGLGKARDLGESAKLNLDNVSEEENKKRVYVEIAKRFVEENPTAPVGYEAACTTSWPPSRPASRPTKNAWAS